MTLLEKLAKAFVDGLSTYHALKGGKCIRCGFTQDSIMCDRSLHGELGACIFKDSLPACSECGATCLDVAQGVGEYAKCFGQTCGKKRTGNCPLEQVK